MFFYQTKQLTDHVLRENVEKMFQASFMHIKEQKNYGLLQNHFRELLFTTSWWQESYLQY